jgi:O-antigen ligase
VAAGLQLVPLGRETLLALSAATDRLLRNYDLLYSSHAAAGNPAHPLSIDPARTVLGLIFLASFASLMLATARTLTASGLLYLVRGIVILGVVLALIGIIQKPLYSGKVYGFWTPLSGGSPFGPFINRNHFAGWMLMALPLAIGYFCRSVTGAAVRMTQPDLRWRVLWLAGGAGSETVLAGVAGLVMAVALVFTLSRSAFVGFVAALCVFAWLAVRRARSRAAAAVVGGSLALIALTATAWVGAGLIQARFGSGEMTDLSGRIGAWRIAREFPLAGTGLNTYGAATLFYQTSDLTHHYSEAHSDYLQLAAEGGILLGLPVVFTVAAFAIAIRGRLRAIIVEGGEYWIQVGAMVGLFAIALQELVDFSLQMPGNAVLFAVLAGIALRSPASRTRRRLSTRAAAC